MNEDEHQRFTERFVIWAKSSPDIIGLIAAGSTAHRGRTPDRWSDHDLVVVTPPGAVRRLVETGGWFPDQERILLRFADPAQCINAIYDDGHLVELAISEPRELAWLASCDHRVLVGGVALAAELASVLTSHDASMGGARVHDADLVLARFAKELLVGVKRLHRGELLSASERIRGRAVALLLELIAAVVPSEQRHALDPLDPTRRFNIAYPDIAATIERALGERLENAAEALLAVAEMVVTHHMPTAPSKALSAIATALVHDTSATPRE